MSLFTKEEIENLEILYSLRRLFGKLEDEQFSCQDFIDLTNERMHELNIEIVHRLLPVELSMDKISYDP